VVTFDHDRHFALNRAATFKNTSPSEGISSRELRTILTTLVSLVRWFAGTSADLPTEWHAASAEAGPSPEVELAGEIQTAASV
jgi:hypothetical protein